MSKIEVNQISSQCGSTLTIGQSGDTVTLACGATQSGFGQTYSAVEYCTTAKTAPFTGVSGKGYFVNTTCGAVTVTLPATPTAGDIVSIADLNGTFNTNNLTLCRNGSKINGKCVNGSLTSNGQSNTIIYTGASQGWITVSDTIGGSISQPYNIQYLVVAGGGGGGATCGGNGGGSGGGAGGYRTVCSKTFSVSGAQSYSITVGAGGSPGTVPASHPSPGPSFTQATQGSNSVFSTITSTGGGYGSFAQCASGGPGGPGGSGGGASGGPGSTGGIGNTPPTSPPQGNDGGSGGGGGRGSGGGGAAAVGLNGLDPNGFTGGAGLNTTILGSIPQVPSYGEAGPNPGRYFAGGGGGGLYSGSPEIPTGANNGGLGGGGDGGVPGVGGAGSTNMGGGGGGGGRTAPGDNPANGGAGGSGIVIIRYATVDASPTASGGNIIATCGADTIRIFTSDGTFIAYELNYEYS